MSNIVFTKAMAIALAKKVEERIDLLFPSNKSANFSRKSTDAWQALTDEINAEFGSNVTVEQVREKYKI